MTWALLGSTTGLVAPLLLGSGGFSLQLAPHKVVADVPSIDLAAAALRHVPLVLLVMLHLGVCVDAEGAEAAPHSTRVEKNTTEGGTRDDQTCSKALGFNESSGPKDRSYQDLISCDEHHKRTCCEKNHTAKLHNSVAFFVQERSPRCAKMGQLAMCSLCDGDVGAGVTSLGNLVSLCPSFCSRWFKACVEDFFAPAGSGEGLQPCGHGNLVCSPLGEITQDPEVFCKRIQAPLGAAFLVADTEDDDSCFDGVPAAKTRGPAVKAPYTRPMRRASFPEWWRRYLPFLPEVDIYTLNRISKTMEDNLPGIMIACAALFFGWYVWIGMD